MVKINILFIAIMAYNHICRNRVEKFVGFLIRNDSKGRRVQKGYRPLGTPQELDERGIDEQISQ